MDSVRVIKEETPVETMTDRELLEEMVLTTRATNKTVMAFINDMANNPMLKMFATKFGR